MTRASGVGSWPGTRSREAVVAVRDLLGDGIPHLPELPGRGVGADMVGRAAGLLVVGLQAGAIIGALAAGRWVRLHQAPRVLQLGVLMGACVPLLLDMRFSGRSAVIVFVGYYIRTQVDESPLFKEAQQEIEKEKEKRS